MFPGPQQVPPRPPQRVASAAAVATEFLLAPAAHLGERLGGETFDVESVRHTGGVRRQVPHRGLVAGVGVDHHRLNVAHALAQQGSETQDVQIDAVSSRLAAGARVSERRISQLGLVWVGMSSRPVPNLPALGLNQR